MPVPFTSAIYGDCPATPEGGCAPPLEVQSWPECRRDRAGYDDTAPGARKAMGLTTFGRGPNPVPGAVFEDGTRLELYTGTTTIVVFADDPRLGRRAAGVLAARVQAAGTVPEAQLRALADRPGYTCPGDRPPRH